VAFPPLLTPYAAVFAADIHARLALQDSAIGLYLQVAKAWAEDGFLDNALRVYRKALRVDPTQIEVYEAIADLYRRQGLVTQARAQYAALADYYRKQGELDRLNAIRRRIAELGLDGSQRFTTSPPG